MHINMIAKSKDNVQNDLWKSATKVQTIFEYLCNSRIKSVLHCRNCTDYK